VAVAELIDGRPDRAALLAETADIMLGTTPWPETPIRPKVRPMSSR
jgi:hypothetical protein